MFTCKDGTRTPIGWRNLWCGRGFGSLDREVESGQRDSRSAIEGIPSGGQREFRAASTPWRLTGGHAPGGWALHAPDVLAASASEALAAIEALPEHSRGVGASLLQALHAALEGLVTVATAAAADEATAGLANEKMLAMPPNILQGEVDLRLAEEASGGVATLEVHRRRCMLAIKRVQVATWAAVGSRRLRNLTPSDDVLAAIPPMEAKSQVLTEGSNIRAVGKTVRSPASHHPLLTFSHARSAPFLHRRRTTPTRTAGRAARCSSSPPA